MNAPMLSSELQVPLSLEQRSPPLRVSPALRRFCTAVRGNMRRALEDDERQARRRAVLAMLDRVAASPDVDTIFCFELVLNQSLDLGYRAKPLAAFVFETLQRRLAGRVRRRLAGSGQDADSEEVADLVSTTAMAIQKLIRGARRERHTLRYALLLSIADHRTIDFLRRCRPEYHGCMDDRAADPEGGIWPRPSDGGDPERCLWRSEQRRLAFALRDAVLDAVNSLPTTERAALILVEIDGLGYPEVAEQLGMKRTDVGNVVRRARLRRDRALVPHLRTITGLNGHVGFAEIQADRDLRLGMLRWSAEIGMGIEVSPPEQGWMLSAAVVA